MGKKIELDSSILEAFFDEVSKAKIYQGKNFKPEGIRAVSDIVNDFSIKNKVSKAWIFTRLKEQSWYTPYENH